MHADVLDDPIGAALRGRHASFALTDEGAGAVAGAGERAGAVTGPVAGTVTSAVRYPADVAPFASVGTAPTSADWEALARIAPTGAVALFVEPGFTPGEGWSIVDEIGLTQMTDDAVSVDSSPLQDARDLTSADVPEMLRLTRLTKPGPFEQRTAEFGGYRGVVSAEGTLLAMAGRRLSPPGWVEISAVCTDPSARGRGYARALMLDVARGIRADGDRAFLHVAHGNPARGLYESMGFVARADMKVLVLTRAA